MHSSLTSGRTASQLTRPLQVGMSIRSHSRRKWNVLLELGLPGYFICIRSRDAPQIGSRYKKLHRSRVRPVQFSIGKKLQLESGPDHFPAGNLTWSRTHITGLLLRRKVQGECIVTVLSIPGRYAELESFLKAGDAYMSTLAGIVA